MSYVPIDQTFELVSFGIQLGKLIKSDLEDGKMSVFEIIGLVKLIGPAQRALEGIEQVPVEINDLDSAEAKQLFELIRMAVQEDVSDERARTIAEESLVAVQSLFSAIARIRGINPPRAEIVP